MRTKNMINPHTKRGQIDSGDKTSGASPRSGVGVRLQEISIPGCVECIQFKKIWEEKLSHEFPHVEFKEIDATAPGGQDIIVKYGIMASPGIIINGELFSTGRVNEKKLRSKLHELSSQGDKG